ncbi:MAG: exodeoxyribonuclease VII small subunit [Clostridia bacterium]|nr:exodeoxyribonuclease VII small subunit [Clostridia bacterium]
MADKKSQDKKPIELEEGMKRLDEVVQRLSGEGISLEESLALYEEGVALVRECNARLESAERKISILRMNDDGEITEEPFEANN